MRRDAAQAAASFTSYFDRAHSLDLLLAQNQTFAVTSEGTIDRGAVNRALEYLQVLYPDAIGEACVIDEHGREVARVTQGTPAAAADLSSNEAQNPFFAPTLALGPGEVYQAAPYVSPDTHTWVISNSTWIRLPDGRRLIVHFEVALASFARYSALARRERLLAKAACFRPSQRRGPPRRGDRSRYRADPASRSHPAAGSHAGGTFRGGRLVCPPGDLSSNRCRARRWSPSGPAPYRPDRRQRE